MHGTLSIRNDGENGNIDFKLNSKEQLGEYGIEPHQIKFKTFIKLNREANINFRPLEEITEVVLNKLKKYLRRLNVLLHLINLIFEFPSKLHDQHLVSKLNETTIQISQVEIQVVNETDLIQIVIVWPEEVSSGGVFFCFAFLANSFLCVSNRTRH